MTEIYLHHRIACAPRAWAAVADRIRGDEGQGLLAAGGGKLFGIWRSQIGRPRDELTMITVWPGGTRDAAYATFRAALDALPEVARHTAVVMQPTLRPATSEPPRRQGNYAFRWFRTPAPHWDEFLQLCADAWPGFEAAYDSQVVGLWRVIDPQVSAPIRTLLMTRRPDLAMWERSKLPQGASEAKVRETLSRRYDLCDETVVFTTTLITADDRADTARWA